MRDQVLLMALTGTQEVKLADVIAWAEANGLLCDESFSRRDAQDFLVTVFKHLECFGSAKIQDESTKLVADYIRDNNVHKKQLQTLK